MEVETTHVLNKTVVSGLWLYCHTRTNWISGGWFRRSYFQGILILTRRFARRAVKSRQDCCGSLELTIILEQMGLDVQENLIIASMKHKMKGS